MSLQEGIYRATLQKATLTEAKTGTKQIAYEFILDGILDSSGEFVDCPNVPRTSYRALTPKTIDYAVADLRGIGYDRADFDGFDPDSPNAFDFEGIEITVQLKYETGQDGREREKWEMRRNGSGGKRVESSGVAELNALFGSKLKAANADNGTRAPVARVAPSRPQPQQRDNGVPKDDDGNDVF